MSSGSHSTTNNGGHRPFEMNRRSFKGHQEYEDVVGDDGGGEGEEGHETDVGD